MADQPTKKAAAKTAVPAGAKKPEDRKPKDDGTSDLRVEVQGLTLIIPREALDDFELLDDLNELDQNDNPARLPSVLRRLVGDQWKTVMNHLRDEKTGRVPVEPAMEFLNELMDAADPN